MKMKDMPDMEDLELNISSLIDMCFLLLVYFISTATMRQSEGDLGIKLPGAVAQAEALDMPDEQIIEVRENGSIFLNGREFDKFDSQNLPQLVEILRKYKAACTMAKNEPLITINGEDTAKHQRVIDVMNACASAGIKNITFSATTAE